MNDTKKCPACAEEIKAEAKKCRYCGEDLKKEIKKKQSKILWILMAFVVIISIIPYIISSKSDISLICLYGDRQIENQLKKTGEYTFGECTPDKLKAIDNNNYLYENYMAIGGGKMHFECKLKSTYGEITKSDIQSMECKKTRNSYGE